MQAVATWLVARPLNAVLALAATISLAWFSFLSGVVVVLLVLHKGARSAAIEIAGAGALMLVVGVIAKVPLLSVIVGALAIWIPAMFLATVLRVTRSLTLTLQISVLLAVAAMLAFFVLVGDPNEFWREVLVSIVELWRELGLTDQAAVLDTNMESIVEQMTMAATVTSWSVHVASCVLGYKLFRVLPDGTDQYGRFQDLNFGRVIALLMALASIGAYLSGAAWLQNIAFVLFAIFWMQGLAIVHWLHGNGLMPLFGVVAVYILAPFLSVVLMVGLAVTGYIDAWFGFRRLSTAR